MKYKFFRDILVKKERSWGGIQRKQKKSLKSKNMGKDWLKSVELVNRPFSSLISPVAELKCSRKNMKMRPTEERFFFLPLL